MSICIYLICLWVWNQESNPGSETCKASPLPLNHLSGPFLWGVARGNKPGSHLALCSGGHRGC